MAYGMDQLRKAGQAIRDMDDAYSLRIANMYPDTKAGVVGQMFGGGMPSTRPAEVMSAEPGAIDKAMSYALPAINAVPKYVLPAAGVTLAGKGLVDMANVIGQQTSTTLEPN
jgi:hypothetical protein